MYKKIGELSPEEIKKARKILRKMFLNNQKEKDDDTQRIKEKIR